jgi:hypothetical protein
MSPDSADRHLSEERSESHGEYGWPYRPADLKLPAANRALSNPTWQCADRPSPGLEELKDENEKLKKSLGLLHAYSLKVHGERNELFNHRSALLDLCEAVGSWMRQDCQANPSAKPLLNQLDGALADIKSSTTLWRPFTSG